MDKRLSLSNPLIRGIILLTIILVVFISISLIHSSNNTAQCTGQCQACYCDKIVGPCCMIQGKCSACIGCVGSCSGEPPNAKCKASSGIGGCGNSIAWHRDSDCNVTPAATKTPEATATPTPRPPAGCPTRTWIKVQSPEADIKYEPPYPLVARQDTTNTGFTLHFNVTGGWAKKYEQKPEQMCKTSGDKYPDDCPNDWKWVCVRRVIEQHNDPIVEVNLGMRLGDGVKEWIENDLGSRYYGAKPQDDLPRVWQLYKGGGVMSWTYDFEYHPYDPGVHGGRLFVITKGTPLNPPQEISFPYTVPVYLWDTTEGGD